MRRSITIGQSREPITAGNHQWHGAVPSFIKRAIIVQKLVTGGLKMVCVGIRLADVITRIIIDAQAWVIKYFIISWDLSRWGLLDIIGKNERRFSSNPIHIITQLFEEIEIIVPINRVLRNINI